jgi:cytolysin-activating lysine-acyltransferase
MNAKRPQSFLRVGETPSDTLQKFSPSWGFMAMLLAANPKHCRNIHDYLVRIFEPALHHGKVKFFFNDDGDLVGHVIWAMLAEDVERRVLEEERFDLHESEWNEGTRLWIVDFLMPYGNLKYAFRELRDNVLCHVESARYMRIKKGKFVAIEIERNSWEKPEKN